MLLSPPTVTNCHTFPDTLERDVYFMDGPFNSKRWCALMNSGKLTYETSLNVGYCNSSDRYRVFGEESGRRILIGGI